MVMYSYETLTCICPLFYHHHHYNDMSIHIYHHLDTSHGPPNDDDNVFSFSFVSLKAMKYKSGDRWKAAMMKMGPNNVRYAIWAISSKFFFSFHVKTSNFIQFSFILLQLLFSLLHSLIYSFCSYFYLYVLGDPAPKGEFQIEVVSRTEKLSKCGKEERCFTVG